MGSLLAFVGEQTAYSASILTPFRISPREHVRRQRVEFAFLIRGLLDTNIPPITLINSRFPFQIKRKKKGK